MTAVTWKPRRWRLARGSDLSRRGSIPDRLQRVQDLSTAGRHPIHLDVDIADDDPLLAFMASLGNAIDLERVPFESPAVRALGSAGVALIVPLVTQGELLGLLTLGPRLSEQEYSSDDRKLLDDLAGYAAPAVRIAQLVRQHEAEVRERSRIEQELRVATLIQQQFLPRELPNLSGWQVEAFYQPAREVGGDFYDFLELPDGRTGIVVGDVTDKGVPAALIMAKTHSILRGEAPRLISPGAVLARANELLVAEMPSNMFVTCLFAVLDPVTGALEFANAGHPVPYVRATDGSVRELRACGMPLGLLPSMEYEEMATVLQPGERVLLHSDGVAEAHGAGREMFGFDRLAGIVGNDMDVRQLIDEVLRAVRAFTAGETEQEDDITLVALARGTSLDHWNDEGPRMLLDIEIPSAEGNERLAMRHVEQALQGFALDSGTRQRLLTAVAEASMNAIEHGNHNDPSLPVRVQLEVAHAEIRVTITDCGDGPVEQRTEEPDLAAKLEGLQSPRGWGLFLIRNMVDDLRVSHEAGHHRVELIMRIVQEGDTHAQNG